MNIQRSIRPVSSMFLKCDLNHFNQTKKAFSNIFEQVLNNKSGSRPPKIELRGILVPCSQIVMGYKCNYKLETNSDEYFLSMSDSLVSVAKRVEWEEVVVKGYLDAREGLVEVEKISFAGKKPSLRYTIDSIDSNSEEDEYKKRIDQQGKLDMAPEYLAS